LATTYSLQEIDMLLTREGDGQVEGLADEGELWIDGLMLVAGLGMDHGFLFDGGDVPVEEDLVVPGEEDD
jgi:uncharacterized membrane protein (UPF0127 family)